MDKGVAKAELDEEYIIRVLNHYFRHMANLKTRKNNSFYNPFKGFIRPEIYMPDNKSLASCGTNIETVKAWREST